MTDRAPWGRRGDAALLEPLRDAVVSPGAILARGLPLPPLPRGYVLLRVRLAAWTGFDEAVRAYGLCEHGVALGASGAGVPVDHNVEEAPQARLLAPVCVSREWLPGVSADGFLATYTAAPLDCLEEAPDAEYSAFSLHASLACSTLRVLAEEGVASAAVIGGGVYGHLAALLLSSHGFRVAVWSTYRLRCSGCSVSEAPPSGAYEALVSATASASMLAAAAARLRGVRVYVATPWSPSPWHLPAGGRLTVYTVQGERGRGCWRRLLADAWSALKHRVVGASGLSEPPVLGDGAAGYLYRL